MVSFAGDAPVLGHGTAKRKAEAEGLWQLREAKGSVATALLRTSASGLLSGGFKRWRSRHHLLFLLTVIAGHGARLSAAARGHVQGRGRSVDAYTDYASAMTTFMNWTAR